MILETEPLEVERYNTTIPPAVAIKQEPNERSIEAGNGTITKTEHETEPAVHRGNDNDIKTEPSERTNTEQHTGEFNDDFWDDVPVFYGKSSVHMNILKKILYGGLSG